MTKQETINETLTRYNHYQIELPDGWDIDLNDGGDVAMYPEGADGDDYCVGVWCGDLDGYWARAMGNDGVPFGRVRTGTGCVALAIADAIVWND